MPRNTPMPDRRTRVVPALQFTGDLPSGLMHEQSDPFRHVDGGGHGAASRRCDRRAHDQLRFVASDLHGDLDRAPAPDRTTIAPTRAPIDGPVVSTPRAISATTGRDVPVWGQQSIGRGP